MRCLYTMLLWALQRIAELVRARERTSLWQCRSRGPVLPVAPVPIASPRCTAGQPPLHAVTSQRMHRCALCLRSSVAGIVRLDASVHGGASSHQVDESYRTSLRPIQDPSINATLVRRPRWQPVLKLCRQWHISSQLPGAGRRPGQRKCRPVAGCARLKSRCCSTPATTLPPAARPG